MNSRAYQWKCKTEVLSLQKPILVGILNVTPDSFSDGGKFQQQGDALVHVRNLVNDGASIIDVGGESTRPGAKSISEDEQIERTAAIIEAISSEIDVYVSIDTTRSRVAAAALSAGAIIVNDVSGGLADEGMLPLVANEGCGLVLMHRRLLPELDSYSDEYAEDPISRDIVSEVYAWLSQQVNRAIEIGIQKKCIAVDPGFGFGKSVPQNWEIVERLSEFHKLDLPLYLGASRKSFLGAISGITSPIARDEVSAAVAAEMAMQGGQIFRVHNVHKHARVLQSLPTLTQEI